MTLSVATYPYLDSAELFDCVAGDAWAMYFDSGNLNATQPRASSERYDVLVMQPVVTLISEGEQTLVEATAAGQKLGLASPRKGRSNSRYKSSDDPLSLLQAELAATLPQLTPQELRSDLELDAQAYLPGAYGYFSYDLARRFEELPSLAEDDEALPQMAMGLYDVVVVVDHQHKRTLLISALNNVALESQWQLHILKVSSDKATTRQGAARLRAQDLQENQSREDYRAKFASVRHYTIEGDCYQVNLTKRFACQVSGSAWATYRALRESSPAPYGAFMHLPFGEVLSNSPESFIRCHDRIVTTSPIKGTRPRDRHNPERDQEIANSLLMSPKDRAENLMIVDLMRNDLSRCCELGTVKVPKLFTLHAFANVHHLISTVTGVLKRELHVLDLLRSCFPGGSITGAPKIRAMQIIEELEPNRRGLYCGSIGYVGMNGNLETNIAIRTIVVKDGVARFSAGGGLVIDSDAEEEYQELLDKASMMKAALLEQ